MAEAPSSLSTLCKELATVQGKWFKVGIHSGVPYEKLQEFKKEDYPLAAVFNYCLKGNADKPLTWKSIVSTLRSEDVEEGGLADAISKKYCQEEERPSQKHKAMLPYSGCYLFINDSNMWIEGQKASAKKLEDMDKDPRYRVDLGRFVVHIAKGRIVLGAYLYGSTPPPNDSVWNAAKEKNFDVRIFKRSETGQEKALNTAMTSDITKTIYTLDPQEKDDVVFIAVTGDCDLKPPIDDALKNNITVELWSWEDGMSRDFRQLANTNPLFTAYALDKEEDAFSYTSYMSSRYRVINPAKAIAYRNVPKTKSFLYELAVYLNQLMRYFYITPIVRENKDLQDLIVEFPKTEPEIILEKIKTLGNFDYQPCSYPEYTHGSAKISSKEQLTNQFLTINTESQEDDDGGWASVLHRNPQLQSKRRWQRDVRCKWGDHCAMASNCSFKHTEEEKRLFASNPNIRFNYRKTRLCNNKDQHVTEQQRKRCIFAHTNEDSWCTKCAMYGHLTDDCKV